MSDIGGFIPSHHLELPVAVLGVSVTHTYSIYMYKYKINDIFFLVE